MRELSYRLKRVIARASRSVLYAVMPRWLVRESMMYASRYFKPTETVPDVPFMTVFGRVCSGEKAP